MRQNTIILTALFAFCLIVPSIVGDDSTVTYDSLQTAPVIIGATAVPDTGEVPYPLTSERAEALSSYATLTNVWRFVEFFVGLASLAIILFTGLSARMQRWSESIKVRFPSLWLFLALFMLADYLINFPVHVYRAYFVELQYGFMNQSFMQWFGEDLLGQLVALVFGIIPLWFLYWLINRSKRWWLQFSLGALPYMVLIMFIVPIYIQPMSNNFTPLQDKSLETKLLQLSNRAGVSNPDIFEVNASKQSSKVTAYVTGLLSSKRIVLNDTLIDAFTHDEILFVMGHEMGHYVMNHIWQMLGLMVILLMIMMWMISKLAPPIISKFTERFRFDRIGQVASLPVILALVTVLQFVGQPIMNGFSRHLEHRADMYGMDISGVSGDVAASAFDKLSAYNLMEPRPNSILEFWFYDHPAIAKRIAFVKSYRR